MATASASPAIPEIKPRWTIATQARAWRIENVRGRQRPRTHAYRRWGDWSVTAIGIPASAGAARTPSFAARIEIARSQSFRVRSATCRRHGGLSLAGDGRGRHAARLLTHDGARKEDTAKLATRGVGLVRPVGFEPTTYSSGGCRSIQLSYGRLWEGMRIVTEPLSPKLPTAPPAPRRTMPAARRGRPCSCRWPPGRGAARARRPWAGGRRRTPRRRPSCADRRTLRSRRPRRRWPWAPSLPARSSAP